MKLTVSALVYAVRRAETNEWMPGEMNWKCDGSLRRPDFYVPVACREIIKPTDRQTDR